MILDPIWHPRLLLTVTLLLLVLLGWRTWRERRQQVLVRQWPALLCRVLLLAGVLLIMAHPQAVRLVPVPAQPVLQVLIDRSASMATADVDGQSRLAAAQTAVTGALAAWQGYFQTRIQVFDRRVQPASTQQLAQLRPEGDASALGAALATSVTDSHAAGIGAGVLLLSDGRATDDGAEAAARLALARGVPLWICPLGGAVDHRDLSLRAASGTVLAFAGATVGVAIDFRQQGYPGRSFLVTIHDGETLVGTQELRPDAEGRARLTLNHPAPPAGETTLRFSVATHAGEVRTDNNSCAIPIQVVAERARVLLLEGQPHWDSKFLVQSLVRCPQVALTAIHQLADGRRFTIHDDAAVQRDGSALPEDAAALQAYDAIILGRGCDALVAAIGPASLADYVAEQGGNLILARGRPLFASEPIISALDPIVYAAQEHSGGPLRPVWEARDHVLFDLAAGADDWRLFADLPPIDALQATDGAKPLAQVLARCGAAEDIAIAQQPYGLGRVLAINGAGLWRWAFNERRNEFEEFVYDRLWLGMLRWMLAGSDFRPGHTIALTLGRRVLTDTQILQVLIRQRDLPDFIPHLRITGPDVDAVLHAEAQGPGRFLARAGPYPPGTYQLSLSGAGAKPARLERTVQIHSASLEGREPSADPALLTQLARISEGRLVDRATLTSLPALYDTWHRQQQLNDETTSLWDRWWFLVALLLLLAGEWFLRRRGGLL